MSLLALVTSPIGRWLCGVAAGALLLGGTWVAGDVHGKHACEAAHARAAATAAARMQAADTHIQRDVVAPLRAANAATQAAIAAHTADLRQEVSHAIPPAADCAVPGAAVSLLDSAVDLPTVPSVAGGPVQAAPATPLSAVVDTSIYNDGVAQGALAEDATWRAWYVKAQAAYDQATGQKPAQ